MPSSAPRMLCVLPARGGSKRIERKNARLVAGVPMIERTLTTVLHSGVADRIVVSTDDDEIADIALARGADVPFRRPAELADDHTPTAPVVSHAINTLVEQGDADYDFVIVVYPTAVLVSESDLIGSRDAGQSSEADLVMTVCANSSPIERAWRRRGDGRGEMLHPEYALTRTQDLGITYYDAGQFYLGTRRFWTSGGDIARSEPLLWPLPRWRAVDIDTEEDLEFVERLLATQQP